MPITPQEAEKRQRDVEKGSMAYKGLTETIDNDLGSGLRQFKVSPDMRKFKQYLHEDYGKHWDLVWTDDQREGAHLTFKPKAEAAGSGSCRD